MVGAVAVAAPDSQRRKATPISAIVALMFSSDIPSLLAFMIITVAIRPRYRSDAFTSSLSGASPCIARGDRPGSRLGPPGPSRKNGSPAGSNGPPRNMAWRKRQVCACSAWAIHARTRSAASSCGSCRRGHDRAGRASGCGNAAHCPRADAAARRQHVAEEGGRLRRRPDQRLARMQAKPPAGEVVRDLPPPLLEHRRVVVEQREVVDVAQVALGRSTSLQK